MIITSENHPNFVIERGPKEVIHFSYFIKGYFNFVSDIF
jgi:hypothetical protein